MLEAYKSRVFEEIFAVYNRQLLKRRFHSFHVSGLDFLLNKPLNLPLIIYCNHSSWWDGLLAFQLSRNANLNSFVMMEEKHLKRLFLFRRLGAFSVVREKPKQALQSINYAARLLLDNPKRTLWIFPQGEILPNDLRPISFFGGLSKIIEKVKNCSVASLSMRYEFLGEYKPQIFVRIEKPENISIAAKPEIKQMTADFAEKLTKNLDQLKTDVINQNFEGYINIL